MSDRKRGNRTPNRYKGGRPTSAYIERRGERAVKIGAQTHTVIELLSVAAQVSPVELVARWAERARLEYLSGGQLCPNCGGAWDGRDCGTCDWLVAHETDSLTDDEYDTQRLRAREEERQ